MPGTAEKRQARSDVPSQGPSVFFDPSALDLVIGDATVLTRFIQFVSQDVAEEQIPVSKIEVRGSADPEDDTRQILVRAWMRGSDSEIRQYHHALGGRVDGWAIRLLEAYQQYFHSRISFQIRREANAGAIYRVAVSGSRARFGRRSSKRSQAQGRRQPGLLCAVLMVRDKAHIVGKDGVHERAKTAVAAKSSAASGTFQTLRELRTHGDYVLRASKTTQKVLTFERERLFCAHATHQSAPDAAAHLPPPRRGLAPVAHPKR